MIAAAGGGLGLPSLFGLLLTMEAGVPIPLPGDLLMLVVGERVAAGALPLWLAVAVLELIALAGTAALFLLARGPARALLTRAGPWVGLTGPRLQRATALLERGGRSTLAAGRATPGLRTVTVVTAASSGLGAARALPALAVGSSVFLQAHLLLGLALGPAAREVLDRARLPLLLGLVAVFVVAAMVWLRRRDGARRALADGCCPVCLAVGAVGARRLRGG